MKLTRCIPAADGGSRLVEADIPIDHAGTDLHGNTLFHHSATMSAEGVVLAEFPQGFAMDWHPAPRRQLAIVLSGTAEFEASDGTKLRFTDGQVLLADDVGSRGHRARTIGGPVRVLFVHLPPDADIGDL